MNDTIKNFADSMSDPQHTPGPWEVTRSHDFCISKKGRSRYIAVCSFGLNYNESGDIMPCETQANARLIAAAPELLEALKFASKELHQHVDYGRDNNPVTYATDKIDSAIAKAEGK